jgi:4-amino-4-deoxy-L-arabinose transferase-like glycosyltransferase
MSVPDPHLIFLNTLSIFTAYAYFKEKKIQWLLICAVSLGLGTLAKGPVAIALPGGALLAWIIWEGRWKEIFTWKILLAIAVTLAVALPWYWMVHERTNGEWTKGFFLKHNIGRFSEAMEGHGGLFIVVPLFVLVGLLPFSVFIGEAVKQFRSRFRNPLLRLSFCVMSVFLVFYAVSGTKLPNYPMPCYPFIAVLLAWVVRKGWLEQNKMKIYPLIILLVINTGIAIGGYFGIKNEQNTRGYEDLTAALFILVLAAMIACYFIIRKNFRWAMYALFSLYALFHALFFNWLYPTIYQQNPMTKLIPTVKQYDKVVAYQIFHPSFTYYLPERIPVFKNLDSLSNYLDTTTSVVVISRQSFKGDLERINVKEITSFHDLFEGNTTALFRK